jgi:hypothetical protein
MRQTDDAIKIASARKKYWAPPSVIGISDLRAAAKMLPHITALLNAGYPVNVLVVTGRLHNQSGQPLADPNDDWSYDGNRVQIIVKNPRRVSDIVKSYLSRRGVRCDFRAGYKGLSADVTMNGIMQHVHLPDVTAIRKSVARI